MKIRPVGAEMFHGDGRTDGHDEANSRFSQFREKRLLKKEGFTAAVCSLKSQNFTAGNTCNT